MWGVTQVTCIASVSAFDCTSFGLSAVSSSCISVTAFPAASSCVSPLSYLFRSWPTIVELASVYKRLREFEKAINASIEAENNSSTTAS